MDFKDALDSIVNEIKGLMERLIEKAPFDKTYTGVVISGTSDGSGYIYSIQVNGKDKSIKSNLVFSVGEYVKVLVPRNDWTRATIALESGKYLPLTGGTVTDVTKYLNNQFYIFDDYTKGNTPSSNIWRGIRLIDDTDSEDAVHRLGVFETQVDTSGNVMTRMRAYKNAANTNTAADIRVDMPKNGTGATAQFYDGTNAYQMWHAGNLFKSLGNAAYGASITKTVANSTQGIIVSCGQGTANGIITFRTTSSGGTSYQSTASGLSISTGTNTITITNNATAGNSAYFYGAAFMGSIT